MMHNLEVDQQYYRVSFPSDSVEQSPIQAVGGVSESSLYVIWFVWEWPSLFFVVYSWKEEDSESS